MGDYEQKVTKNYRGGSLRKRNKDWMNSDVVHPKAGKKYVEKKNYDLLNIGKNTDELTGDEKIFYLDQCGERRHLLSQEVYMDDGGDNRRNPQENTEMLEDGAENSNPDSEFAIDKRNLTSNDKIC